MPWWGWLIAALVVFVVLVYAFVALYAFRSVQRHAAEESKRFDDRWQKRGSGPQRPGRW